jgi:hypothetical protein
VAIAVWANAISARGAHPDLSILLLNAPEKHYAAIGEQCIVSIGKHCIVTNCYLLRLKEEKKLDEEKKKYFGGEFLSGEQICTGSAYRFVDSFLP